MKNINKVIKKAKFALLLSSLLFPLVVSANNTSDLDGDSKADKIFYNSTNSRFSSLLSSGSTNSFDINANTGSYPLLGDLDGDNIVDTIAVDRANMKWNVKTARDSYSFNFGSIGENPSIGDIDADGCDDAIVFNRRTGTFKARTCANPDSTLTYKMDLALKGAIPVVGDYTCDGRDDLAVYNQNFGQWVIYDLKSKKQTVTYFGLPGDYPIPADYQGNGCILPAVYRPAASIFYIAKGLVNKKVASILTQFQHGLPGDIPTITDVNGDGASEIAVFRPTDMTLYSRGIDGSFTSTALTGKIEGLSYSNLAQPIFYQTPVRNKVSGDYNRDGRSDVAFVNVDRGNGTTDFEVPLSNGQVLKYRLNRAGDAIVPGDFNGDGRTSPAVVWVRGDGQLEWRIIDSAGKEVVVEYGLNGDTPLVGDLDCDGRDDIVVTRNIGPLKYWYIKFDKGDKNEGHAFGFPEDKPFIADMDGDSCDELIVSRESMGLTYWFYQNLQEGIDRVAQWGFTSDEKLPPADYDGDGAADWIITRKIGAGIFYYIRHDGESAFNPDTDRFSVMQFGLDGDVAMGGDFYGYGRSVPAILRPKENNLYTMMFPLYAEAKPANSNYNTIVTPSGRVIIDTGAANTSGSKPPVTTNSKCEVTTDFKDGGWGALWKPVSESNGYPVFLLNSEYEGADVEIKGSNGEVIGGVGRRKCCPNGNRAHFWVTKKASELAKYKPITVEISQNGIKECRIVNDPTDRVD